MLMVNDVMVTDLVSAKADIIEGGDPEKTLVREIMFKPLIVTSLETSLEEAIEAMFKHKIKSSQLSKVESLLDSLLLQILRIFSQSWRRRQGS